MKVCDICGKEAFCTLVFGDERHPMYLGDVCADHYTPYRKYVRKLNDYFNKLQEIKRRKKDEKGNDD